MICNKCGQEMPEIGAFCPYCGEAKPQEEEVIAPMEENTEEMAEELAEETEEELTEETAEDLAEEAAEEITEEGEEPVEELSEETVEEAAPVRKLKLWQLIAIIAGGIVLLAVLVGAVLYALGVDLKPRKNDLYCKDSYTVTDEQIEKNADKVVATLGNKELTIGELQLYYTNDVYNFINQCYSYMGYLPVDPSLGMDEQKYPSAESEQTWQQYFLETALNSWRSYALLQTLMEEEGYVVSADLQEKMDAMGEEVQNLAVSYGYEDAQTYLNEQLAPGVSVETYLDFNRTYYTSNEYLDKCYAELTPTPEEIDAYYQENLQTFTDNGVEPDMGLQSSVRHILIQPEGGTEGEDGIVTYSDEEKAAAYAKAEEILEQWKAGDATEESFAELANTHSTDGGSNTTGGLYTGINMDASYVEEFRAWAIDASRKEGDTAIVETQFGYHIMYFVSGEDYFTYVVSEQLIAQGIQEMLLNAQETYPMEVNYKKILLYAPEFG